MKKLNFFILFWLMALTTSWSQGDGAFSVQQYYQDLPHDVATELDCIGRKYLDHDGIDRKLRKAFKGYAGFYLQYDQVHRDIPIHGTQHTVILKDDLHLNTIIPAENRFDIPKSHFVEVIKSKEQAVSSIKSIISSDIVPLYQGLYWVQQQNIWKPAYLFLVFIDQSTKLEQVWVNSDSGFNNYNEYKSKTIVKSSVVEKKFKHKSDLQNRVLPSNIVNIQTATVANGKAELYWKYPEVDFQEKIAPFGTTNSGKKILGLGSPLKYNESGENDLEPSSITSLATNFDFIYNGDLSQKSSYAKTFSFLKFIDLFGAQDIRMSVDIAEDYTVSYNGTTLVFGGISGQPAAMDEFWIAYGYFIYKNFTSGAQGSAIYNGYMNYLAQNELGKIGNDGICNHYGLKDDVTYRTDIVSQCFVTNNGVDAYSANTFGSLLSQIHQDPAIGADIVEEIMGDLLANQPAMFTQEKPYEFIYAMWSKARSLQANNTMTMAQLCALRSKFNTYFNGCDVTGDWEPINDQLRDVMIRDYDGDIGAEPHAFAHLYVSPDIWNINDTGFGSPLEPVIGVINKMHVKIKNIGCDEETGRNLKVYWTFANMGLSWPSAWTKLNTDPVVSLDGNSEKTYIIEWEPVDPATVGLQEHKICILARITTDEGYTETSYGWGFDEIPNYGHNIRYNNGISLRNMTLIPKPPGVVGGSHDDDIVTVIIQDPEPPSEYPEVTPVIITCVINLPPPSGQTDPVPFVIDMQNPNNWDPTAPIGPGSNPAGDIKCERGTSPAYSSDPDFFDKGEVWINIKKMGEQAWGGMSLRGTGFVTGPDGWIKMTSPDFELSSLQLVKGQKYLLGVKYKPKPDFATSSFSLVMKNAATQKIMGGELYVISEEDGAIDINGDNLETRSGTNNMDVIIRPNPAKDVLHISSSGNKFSEVVIIDIQGRIVETIKAQTDQSDFMINIRTWKAGLYSVMIKTEDGKEIIRKFVKE
ncbi:MAG: T9SS type A sorting domain-containing protein [Saprospiraceae bacterium]|nr:T9SS type A sorting domain-containing protein [Saprospiraceae bacterium]